MSVRIDINDQIAIGTGERVMEDVIIYATTKEEAMEIDTGRFVMGSVLYVIDEGKTYMLNRDGREGIWRDLENGMSLGEV